MSTETIIASASFIVLGFLLIVIAKNSWRHRDEGTGHEVDLDALQRGNPNRGGAIEPDTISRIECLLKEDADKGQSNS
jgi:hypothetical protein